MLRQPGTLCAQHLSAGRPDRETGSNTDIYWNPSSFGASQEAYITFTNIDPLADEIDLLLKSQSSAGWGNGVLEILYEPVNSRVQVWTYTGVQNWVQRGASIPVTFSNGDQLGARAKANGQVEVYRNGALLATRDITGWPLYANGGCIGLRMIGASNTVMDNFGGGTVP